MQYCGLGFLYNRCKIIRQGTLARISLIPEYVDALKKAAESGAVFDDKEVFEIVQEVWTNDLINQRHNRQAKKIISGISKDLYGDPNAWEYK